MILDSERSPKKACVGELFTTTGKGRKPTCKQGTSASFEDLLYTDKQAGS